jgi:hypothetical protein
MKVVFNIAFILLFSSYSYSQNILITDDDAYSANSSAMLDVKSISKGLLIPRLTTAQRTVISSPATGLLVFDTNLNSFYYYNGSSWTNLSSGIASGIIGYTAPDKVYLADVTDKFGVGTTSPFGKMEVKADASIGANDPIFHVVNKTGDTIFAVYNEGVRINVQDDPSKALGSKGGFAVGGFSPTKGSYTNQYLWVTPDSVRVYVEDNPSSKASGSKGGFAVGGFSPSKLGLTNHYLRVTSDTTRIYTLDTVAGFGIRNLESSSQGNYLRLSPKNYLIGHDAGKSLTTGVNNFIAGYQAGKSLNMGSYNTYIGYQAAYSDLKGADNVFVGYKSGYSNVGGRVMNLPVGYQNTFLGNKAGYSNTQGINNTFVGNEAGFNNIGTFSAIYEAYTGSWNVFLGDQAGFNNTSASHNLYAGMQAGYSSTTGGSNVFLGGYAGRDNSTGINNVFVGSSAGWQNGTGNYNVYIGEHAGYSNVNTSNNIFIGYNAGSGVVGSGKFVLTSGYTSAPETNAFMYGDMLSYSEKFLRLNQKLGVNITPAYVIHSVDNSTTNDNPAIFGSHEVTEGYGVGVEGRGKYRGVKAYCSSSYAGAIQGANNYASNSGSGGAYGSYNTASTTSGAAYGVYGYAYSSSGTAYAGYFAGNVSVTGTLSKGGGSFKIDHPLDPENKYLYHSFVESPDMMNIYNGNAVCDNTGKAVVELPAYFEALNMDFRYQLTTIGGFAQVYIEQEVQNNKFVIAGGTPNLKVSWQVTGVRNDPFAVKNRVPTEVDKSSDEKGLYLYPDVYNKSSDKSINSKLFNSEK